MLQKRYMIICVDFDGTIVEHMYPKIGKEVPGAIEGLQFLQKQGHQLILYTMRSEKFLEEAVAFIKSKGIDLYAVNENPTQKEWTSSPKVYGHAYIDDAAIGSYLIHPEAEGSRPYIDWFQVMLHFGHKGNYEEAIIR